MGIAKRGSEILTQYPHNTHNSNKSEQSGICADITDIAHSPRTPSLTTLPDSQRAKTLIDYHRYWTALWDSERIHLKQDPGLWLVLPSDIHSAASQAVDAWNTSTGDARSLGAFMAELDTPDLTDREMMTPAWLHLYCYTLWHWYAT